MNPCDYDSDAYDEVMIMIPKNSSCLNDGNSTITYQALCFPGYVNKTIEIRADPYIPTLTVSNHISQHSLLLGIVVKIQNKKHAWQQMVPVKILSYLIIVDISG